jgi:hypothetical protein
MALIRILCAFFANVSRSFSVGAMSDQNAKSAA